jgi:hypothetical protein
VVSGTRGGRPRRRTTATARVWELSRGGRRKNDRIDAAAAACVAAMQGDARRSIRRVRQRFSDYSTSDETNLSNVGVPDSAGNRPRSV